MRLPALALSLAALEGPRADTLYLATAGGMGPGTLPKGLALRLGGLGVLLLLNSLALLRGRWNPILKGAQ